MDQSLSNLGPRIKALRQEQGLTLQEVSERSGVAVSTLSKIENGHLSGTVNTMLKIARGLGLLFDQLLEPEDAPAQPTGRLVRTGADNVDFLSADFYDYEVHSTELVGRRMLPLVMTIKTPEPPPYIDWSTHEGEEFLLVLEGRIQLHTEHYAPITLNAGESVYFDSLMRHAYVSVGEGNARVVSVSLEQRPTHQARGTPLQVSAANQPASELTNGGDADESASRHARTSTSTHPTRGRTEQ